MTTDRFSFDKSRTRSFTTAAGRSRWDIAMYVRMGVVLVGGGGLGAVDAIQRPLDIGFLASK
jgi:hypothetical protein